MTCPHCAGAGFVISERNGYSAAARCRCLSDAIAAQHLRDAGVIGPRSHSRLFEMCRIVRMPAAADYRRAALP